MKVTVEPIELSAIEIKEQKYDFLFVGIYPIQNLVFFFGFRIDTLKTIESSLRVDALASAGFKMSRTKLSDLIE